MMLIATAAATSTFVLLLEPLSPVEALGVLLVEELLPVVLREEFAFVSWSSDFLLTSPPSPPVELSVLLSVALCAPLAPAIASDSLSDDPFAVRPTAPPAVMFRRIFALTSSSTIARASARPIDTSPPAACALAVVVAFVSCVAVSVTAPVAASDCEPSPSMVALVRTVG
jgi:hypothetical protein